MCSEMCIRDRESGLENVEAQVQRMVNDARHTFDLALSAVTGGAVETVADEIRTTDRQINSTEIEIRRALIVHASVHGGIDTPEVLAFMNMIKDIERIGDYNKNIFDLAEEGVSFTESPEFESIISIRDEVSSRVSLMGEILSARDEDLSLIHI